MRGPETSFTFSMVWVGPERSVREALSFLEKGDEKAALLTRIPPKPI
jgi:hypothetical protein